MKNILRKILIIFILLVSSISVLSLADNEVDNSESVNYNDEVMNKLTILTTDKFFKSLGIDVHSTLMSEINHNWGVLLDKRKIEFFDGVKELLYYLKNKGFFLGIATSRDMEELRELSDIIECLDLFDYVEPYSIWKSDNHSLGNTTINIR